MPDKIDIKTIGKSNADPKVKEVYQDLKRFRDAPERRAWVKRDTEAYNAAVLNKMWDQDDEAEAKASGQIPIVVNKLNKGIQGNAAIVTQNNPQVIVRPLRYEDPYIATMFGWGIDYVFRKNSGQDVVYDVVERKNTGGLGFFNIFHDPDKGVFGRTVIEENDPSIWYFDKDSRKRDLSDTSLIKAQLRTKKWIKEHYDNITDEDLSFERQLSQEEAPGEVTDTVEGADNYTVDPDKDSPDAEGEEKEIKEVWEIEAHMLKTEREDWIIWEMNNGEADAAKIQVGKGQKIQEVVDEYNSKPGVRYAKHWRRNVEKRYLRIIVGRKLIPQLDDDGNEVFEVENPYGLDSDGDPIVPGIPLIAQKTRCAYPTCPTFYALPLNKALNKRHAQEIFAVSKTLNSPVVRSDGTRWSDPKSPDKPGTEMIVSKNSAFQPYRLPPGTVDISGLRDLIRADEENIDDQFDTPEILKGKVPKNFQGQLSGRLGLALQDTALMKANPALRGLESALEKVGKVVLAIILKHWPRQMWERLLKKEDRQTLAPEGSEENKQQQKIEQQRIQDSAMQGAGMGAPEPQDVDPEEELKAKVRQRWQDALDRIENEGISLVDLDVAVTAGSTLPTNRMAKEDLSIEKFKIGLFDRRAALEYSDDPKAKETSERMDARELALAQAGATKGVK